MRVLVGCEESQVVCNAFRNKGHDAFSCDLVPTRGNPLYHLQMDVLEALLWPWDMIILHPDCTKLSLSGNRWYGTGMPRNAERLRAIEWTVTLWKKATSVCDKVALENPTSVIWKHLPNVQYIQPFMFGHGETKKTGLCLKGLPELRPTNEVEGREQRVWKMPPSPTRKRDRAKTYKGIAEAMADQWGGPCS